MIKTKYIFKYRFWLLLIGIVVLSLGFTEGDKSGKTTSPKIYKLAKVSSEGGKYGDAYRLNINNINMPMNRSGKIADVNIPPEGSQGRFDESTFFVFRWLYVKWICRGHFICKCSSFS